MTSTTYIHMIYHLLQKEEVESLQKIIEEKQLKKVSSFLHHLKEQTEPTLPDFLKMHQVKYEIIETYQNSVKKALQQVLKVQEYLLIFFYIIKTN